MMGFSEDICVTVSCDGCGHGWTTATLRRTPHFVDYDQARDYLVDNGWSVDGPRLVCPDCTQLAICADAGHSWGDWHRAGPLSLPGGRVWSGHLRCCRTCPDSEWAPPLTDVATVATAEAIASGSVQ